MVLVKTWCEALEIELKWLELSEIEINNLNDYFTGNLRIMRCKEAAISVAPSNWKQVEEKMFRML